MTNRLVRLDWQDEVAIISLNRPARHNALIPELLLDLLAALSDERCLSAPVLILRAEGDSFSTGGDLLGFWQKRGNIAEYAHELVGLLNQVIVAIYTHPAVVVCAVQGQVTGGSLGLLLVSDRVIMTRKATITPWYGEVGFSPDGGWKALLPEVIGHQQAMQWLASNGCYDALACMNLGVVHQVVDEDCTVSALKWAENAAGNKSDLTSRDHSLSNLNTDELCHRLEAERESFVTQIQTQQALDGISQFLRRA